ncbi:hypothetical protein NY2A_b135L [Paramecium bursaria Chlorella virus NY2A]|uniref:Uncharacterized protein b135L n=1 Tax=Paramecium bursaria Chlorella virus NY2A TaxID=46021 RepID=A7IW10_PBCVN|nr:hypothetical protein NY2A_b135L [Paramecium bursaria Chlorella virus NY2A]ABT14534.1 hypothetical protein NY2A_b135L [Paramecium bursaria Chlorella virus NY2A]
MACLVVSGRIAFLPSSGGQIYFLWQLPLCSIHLNVSYVLDTIRCHIDPFSELVHFGMFCIDIHECH